MTQTYGKSNRGPSGHLPDSGLVSSLSNQASFPGAILLVCGAIAAPEHGGKEEPLALASLIGAHMPSVTCLAHNLPSPRPSTPVWEEKQKTEPALFTPLFGRDGWQGATHSATKHQGLKQAPSHRLSNLMPYVA